MKRNALIAAFIVALTCFAPVGHSEESVLGVSLCSNVENETRILTNECSVYVEDNAGGKWVDYSWVDYIHYKYPSMVDDDIVITRLDFVQSGTLTLAVYYTRHISPKVNY